MSKKLSASRKADRAIMAQRVANRALEAGALSATISIREWNPRETTVAIEAPGGAYINVDIDGDLPDILGGTWNTPQAVFLNPSLGDVNPHHFGKLNVLVGGGDLDYLLALLESHLARFVDGSGYLTHDAPQIVAMRARYAAQGWSDPCKPRPAFAD